MGVSDEVFFFIVIVVVLVFRVPDNFGQGRLQAEYRYIALILEELVILGFTGLTAPTSDKIRSLYPEINAAIVTSPFRPKGLKDMKAGRRKKGGNHSKDERE